MLNMSDRLQYVVLLWADLRSLCLRQGLWIPHNSRRVRVMPPVAQELLLLLDQKLLPGLLPAAAKCPRAPSRLGRRSSLDGKQRPGQAGSAGMIHIVACRNEGLYACRSSAVRFRAMCGSEA